MDAKITSLPGQYLTFVLKGQTYGVPIGVVREINRVGEITEVPQTPPYVAGVMNLRGRIVPVVDLRVKLGFAATAFTKNTCIIVMEASSTHTGAIVDAVVGVTTLLEGQIEARPTFGGPEEGLGYISGLGKTENEVIILLDALAALDAEALKEQVEASGHLKGAA